MAEGERSSNGQRRPDLEQLNSGTTKSQSQSLNLEEDEDLYGDTDGDNETINEETAFLQVVFDRLDVGRTGRATREDVSKCLQNFGGGRNSRTELVRSSNSLANAARTLRFRSTPSFVQDKESDQGSVDFSQFCSMMLKSRYRTKTGHIILHLVATLLPLLYAANTRLIFIFVALEAVDERNAEMWKVSVVLGCYQTCRAFANAIIGGIGGAEPFRRCFVPMTSFGLAGWGLSLLLSRDSVWNLLFLSCVGFTETVVCLQDSLLKETRAEHVSAMVFTSSISQRMRYQYAGISMGSTIAYILGGFLYKTYGFICICWFGLSVSAAQIIIGIIYILFGATADDTGDTSPSHTHSYIDPHHAQLKLLAYKVAAAKVLERETEGKGPTRQQVAAVLPIASRNNNVRVALQELYHSLAQGSRSCLGEAELNTLLRLGISENSDNSELLRHASDYTKSTVTTATTATTGSQMSKVGTATRATVGLHLMHSRTNGSKLTEHEFVTYMLPRVHLALHPHSLLHQDSVPNYLQFVVATQAIMALCIGTFLSTSLLYYNQVHKLSSAAVGVCLGVGELLGASAILIVFVLTGHHHDHTGHAVRGPMKSRIALVTKSVFTLARFYNTEIDISGCFLTSCLKILLSRPLHVPVILLCLSTASMCFVVPSLTFCIASQLLMSSINDLSVSLLNELTAVGIPQEKFKSYQSFGQWLRRLGNCLTAFAGPVLFNVAPELPFVLFGCLVLVWTLVLWSILLMQARLITPGFDIGPVPPITAFRPFIGRKPWHVYETQYYHAKKQDEDNFGTAGLAVLDLEYEVAVLRMQVGRLVQMVNVLEEHRKEQIEDGGALAKDNTEVNLDSLDKFILSGGLSASANTTTRLDMSRAPRPELLSSAQPCPPLVKEPIEINI